MKTKENLLLEDAKQKLQDAREELCRPEEDVVAFMVCKNAQQAIQNYLSAFLSHHGIDASTDITVESLYRKCRSIDPRFEKVDLAGFNCKADNLASRHCSSVEKVSRCFDIADKLDTFLREEKII